MLTPSTLPKKAKALARVPENICRTPKQELYLPPYTMDNPTPSTSSLSPAGFNDYNTNLQATALKATRLSAALPSDIGFYRSVDKTLAKDIDSCKAKVLSLTNKLLDLASSNNDAESRARKRPRLENEDITDDFHGIIVDLMDQLLEKSVSSMQHIVILPLPSVTQDMRIDEFLGVSKVPAPIAESQKQTQVRVCGSVYPI